MQKEDKEYFDGVISTLKQNLGHYDNFKTILEEAESKGFNVDWTISGSPNSWDTDTLLVYILRGYKSDCTNDIIKLLITHGADVNAVSEDRLHRSALFWSCYWPFYPIEIIKLLIDRGADVNAVTDDGQTALEIVTGRYLDLAETHGKELLEKIKLLIEAGADISGADRAIKRYDEQIQKYVERSNSLKEFIKKTLSEVGSLNVQKN